MVPLLVHLIKWTKWLRLTDSTVSRTARQVRPARSPKSYRARLRRRVRRRCVKWPAEEPESSFSQPGESRQKRIGSCEKGSPPRSRRRCVRDRPLLLARRARFDRPYRGTAQTVSQVVSWLV